MLANSSKHTNLLILYRWVKPFTTLFLCSQTLLSVFAMAAVFSAGAYAQTSANGDVTASANVVSSITAGNIGALNFGTILSNDTPSIAADSSLAGYVQFTGATEGSTVDIDVDYPTQLTGTGGAFDFTPSNLGTVSNDGGTPTFGSVTVQTLTTGYSYTVANNGTNTNFFVTVGGSLTPDATPGDGNYEGTITITASYQ